MSQMLWLIVASVALAETGILYSNLQPADGASARVSLVHRSTTGRAAKPVNCLMSPQNAKRARPEPGALFS